LWEDVDSVCHQIHGPLIHESSEIHAGKHDRTDIFALSTAIFSNLALINTMTRYQVWTHRVSDVSDCMALIVTIDDQTFHRRHIFIGLRGSKHFSVKFGTFCFKTQHQGAVSSQSLPLWGIAGVIALLVRFWCAGRCCNFWSFLDGCAGSEGGAWRSLETVRLQPG
jgi:hypothetical protein